MAIIANAMDQLFYMAAAEDRQADSLALDIPSILIGKTGRDWLTTKLPAGVVLSLGGDQSRCSGGRLLTASSGRLQSGPIGQDYCSWQECQWHIAVPTDDIIVLSFSRFTLECMTAADGSPYDYVKAYDGATDVAPLLSTFSCTTYSTVVSTGPHMMLHFHSDDLYNFAGFEATYATGSLHCAALASCGLCSASSLCAWCKASHACLPASGPKAVCTSDSFAVNSTQCCPAGWSGINCDVCAPNHFGASCTPCSCGVGGVCNDGLSGDGSCTCTTGWAGALCDGCATGFWGSTCSACSCAGGSTCDDGINGTGCVCNAGYYGPLCAACTCIGNARCSEGILGSGSCQCDEGFRGVDAGCNACDAGRFGASCSACDCPAHTTCDAGISGSGECVCSGSECADDAGLAFLAVVVTQRYGTPSGPPYVHQPHAAASQISNEVYSYGTLSVLDDATNVDIALAPAQWGARLMVTWEHGGVTTVACNVSLNVASERSGVDGRSGGEPMRNASMVRAILDGATDNFPGAPAGATVFDGMPVTAHRLVRSIALRPYVGLTAIVIAVTSPGGTSKKEFRLSLSRPASSDCSLSSIVVRQRTAAAVSANSPTASLPLLALRPAFSPSAHEYNAALDTASTAVDVIALSRHGERCKGMHDGVYCLRPALLSVSLLALAANGDTSPVGAFSHPSSTTPAEENVTVVSALLPTGRSVLQILVQPETRIASESCRYNLTFANGLLGATEYRLDVSYVASGDVADFPAAKTDAISSAFATRASVASDAVRTTAAPASVALTTTLSFPTSAAATSGRSAVSGAVTDASTLQTFLSSNAGVSLSVTSAPSLSAVASLALVTNVSVQIATSSAAATLAALPSARVYDWVDVGPLSPLSGAEALTLLPDNGNLSFSLPNEVVAVRLAPVAAAGSTYAVECASCSSLPVGETVATITVTAQDQAHVAIVTVVLTRSPSSDCSLASLKLYQSVGTAANAPTAQIATWSTPAVGSLTAAVNNDALKVLVWAQPSHATSTIKYRFRRSTPPGGTCATNPSECTDLASSTLSGRHDLYIGTSYVQLTVTAQAGQACTHLVALTRGKSADTSLSEVSVSLIVNNRISSTTIDATTGTPPNSGVRIIDLANDQNSLRFKAKTGHSVFCSSAAHACVGSASLSLSAPGITWQTYGSESGSKGTLEAIMDVPVGSNAVTLTCVAEDLSTATHLVLLRRAASDDASLRSLAVESADLVTPLATGLLDKYFKINMHANQHVLRVMAGAVSSASVTVSGASANSFFQNIEFRSTYIYLVVTAEDKTTLNNYTLEVTCGHCMVEGQEIGSNEDDQAATPEQLLGSSVWLMLVLLVAATTLCCLSLAVCIRMQCIRASHRRAAAMAAQRRGQPQYTPQELLSRLAPYLTRRKGLPENARSDDGSEEACAICIGELEADEDITQLRCQHCFHTECINGWLCHKGITASCPLCKRLVAPDLVAAADARLARQAQQVAAGVELQDLGGGRQAAPQGNARDGRDQPQNAARPLPLVAAAAASQQESVGQRAAAAAAAAEADPDADYYIGHRYAAAAIAARAAYNSGSRLASPAMDQSLRLSPPRIGTPTAWGPAAAETPGSLAPAAVSLALGGEGSSSSDNGLRTRIPAPAAAASDVGGSTDRSDRSFLEDLGEQLSGFFTPTATSAAGTPEVTDRSYDHVAGASGSRGEQATSLASQPEEA